MAKDSPFGTIEPNFMYTADQLRHFFGKSLRETKSWIRENCVFSEPFTGTVVVLGSDFIRAVVEIGKVDTPEDKEERQRKSGAATRSKRGSEK